jgi:von Willebrand factor type A domain
VRDSTTRFLGQTPLTDPRSLATSTLFHALLVLLASLVVMKVAQPARQSGTIAVHAELDSPIPKPTSEGTVPGEGGGLPGEIGALGTLPLVPSSGETIPLGVARDPVADTLLAEITPASQPDRSEKLQQDLPGPDTSASGTIPGSGPGGGGGEGGGSGGGAGLGVGPGTQFFGAREHARSFAYVIDCSGSMAMRGSLEVAKREVLASLAQLPPDAQFAVIFYNLEARMIVDRQGRQALMPATAANKEWVRHELAKVVPDGGTDHMIALRRALTIKPEVIFFLTDADLMTNSEVDEILAEVGSTRIQAVEFGRGIDLGQRTPLARLAVTTGGTYRYIDVSTFPRSSAGF